MKKAVILLMLSVIGSFAYSQVYLGAGLGNSFHNLKLEDLNGDDFKLNENALGWRIYAGVGKEFLRFEAGYRSLGSVTSIENGIQWQSTITAWDLAAKGQAQLGPIYGNAKLGRAFYKNQVEVAGTRKTDNTVSILWGIGAGVKIKKLSVGLSYESIDISADNNLAQLMLDVSISLGKK